MTILGLIISILLSYFSPLLPASKAADAAASAADVKHAVAVTHSRTTLQGSYVPFVDDSSNDEAFEKLGKLVGSAHQAAAPRTTYGIFIVNESHRAIKPQVRAEIDRIYQQKIAVLKKQQPFPQELWGIIIEYRGKPPWGCSLDEAYAIYKKLNPQASDHNLNLAGYGINSTQSETLRGKHFYCVDLSSNFIQDLPPNAFAFTCVRIYLNNNIIQRVAPGCCANQPQLEHLSLAHNSLIEYQKGMFKGPKYLHSLDLTDCGDITWANPQAFSGLRYLRHLRKGLPRDRHSILPYYFNAPRRFPFLRDDYNKCEFTEVYRGRAMLAGRESPSFLCDHRFWPQWTQALQLIEDVKNTSLAYHHMTQNSDNPHHDSAEYRDYQDALQSRDIQLPAIMRNMRTIIHEHDYPYGTKSDPEDLSDSEQQDSHSCSRCTVS